MTSLHPNETAAAPVADDKGLLAMDESTPTCGKPFVKLGIPQTEEARRAYREPIVTTPGLGESISGVILDDETMVCIEAKGERGHAGAHYPFATGDVILPPAIVGACRGRPNGRVTLLDNSLPEIFGGA